jgi:hypothetical protein
MNLLHKPDWDQTKDRFEVWWAGEAIDRCLVQVTAPKDGVPHAEPPPVPARVEDRWLDYCVHHVDGIGNFVHADALCELPRLQALQILPGAGKPSPLHYMDVLKKVQAAGKNLHISIAANEVETALSELSARGLCINTWCRSEAEAKDLIRNCEKWSKDR